MAVLLEVPEIRSWHHSVSDTLHLPPTTVSKERRLRGLVALGDLVRPEEADVRRDARETDGRAAAEEAHQPLLSLDCADRLTDLPRIRLLRLC